jgi:hypothetical protein
MGGDINAFAYLASGASAWSYVKLSALSNGSIDGRRGAAVVSLGDSAWVIGGSAQAANPILKIAEGGSGPVATQLSEIGVAAHGLLGAVVKNAAGDTRIIATGGCQAGYEVAGGGCNAPLTGVIVIDPAGGTPFLGIVASAGDTNRSGASLTSMPDGTAVYFGGLDSGNALRTDFVVISATTTGIAKTLVPLATGCQAAAQRYRHVAVPLGGTQLAILGGQTSANSYLVNGYVVDTANGNCAALGTLATTGPNSMSLSALGPGMSGGSAWKVGSATAPELFVQSGNGSDAMWNIKFTITNGYVTGLATTNGVNFDNRMQSATTPQTGYIAGPGARDSYLPLQY